MADIMDALIRQGIVGNTRSRSSAATPVGSVDWWLEAAKPTAAPAAAPAGNPSEAPTRDARQSELLRALSENVDLPELETGRVPRGQGIASVIGDVLTTFAQSGTTRGFRPSTRFTDTATGRADTEAQRSNQRALAESQANREAARSSALAELGIIETEKAGQRTKELQESEQMAADRRQREGQKHDKAMRAIDASNSRVDNEANRRARMDELVYSTEAATEEGRLDREARAKAEEGRIEIAQAELDGKMDRLNTQIAAATAAADKATTARQKEAANAFLRDLEMVRENFRNERKMLTTKFEREDDLQQRAFAQDILNNNPEVVAALEPETLGRIRAGTATDDELLSIMQQGSVARSQLSETYRVARQTVLSDMIDPEDGTDSEVTQLFDRSKTWNSIRDDDFLAADETVKEFKRLFDNRQQHLAIAGLKPDEIRGIMNEWAVMALKSLEDQAQRKLPGAKQTQLDKMKFKIMKVMMQSNTFGRAI